VRVRVRVRFRVRVRVRVRLMGLTRSWKSDAISASGSV